MCHVISSHSEILAGFHLELLESLFIDHSIPSDHRRKKKKPKRKSGLTPGLWLSGAPAMWPLPLAWKAPREHTRCFSSHSKPWISLLQRLGPQPQAFCVNTPCFLWGGDSLTALQGCGWHVGWIFTQGLFSWSVFYIFLKGFWNITVKETSRNKSQGFV